MLWTLCKHILSILSCFVMKPGKKCVKVCYSAEPKFNLHGAALLPIRSRRVMKKSTEIIAGQYLIWLVWRNEVYNEEFARSGSLICIEIDRSSSADKLSDLKPRNKVILMCFRLSFGLKTVPKRSNFQSSLIALERECSASRRTLAVGSWCKF